MAHFFSVLINSVLALFFITLGVLCVILPWSEALRQAAITFIQFHGVALFFIGVSFLAIGGAILALITIDASRRHYSLRTGPFAVTIDADLIETYLKEYWHKRYPRVEIPSRVTVKRETIQINADLPDAPQSSQKKLLKEIEGELQELLAAYIGYRKPLRLYISFGE